MSKRDRRRNNKNNPILVTSPVTHITLIAQSSYPQNPPLGSKSPSVLDTLRPSTTLVGIISLPLWTHDLSLLPISLPKPLVLYATSVTPQDMSARTANFTNAAFVIITNLTTLPTIAPITRMALLILGFPKTIPPMVTTMASMVMENSSCWVDNWYFNS